jgi:microcystin-dependent protein
MKYVPTAPPCPAGDTPSHSHAVFAQNVALGGVATPAGNTLNRPASGNLYDATSPQPVAMAPEALAPAGGDAPHNNMMPYLTFYFAIALQSVFPPQG